MEIILGEAHEIKEVFCNHTKMQRRSPREGGMVCPEGYIKSPKAESLVMAGKEGAKKGTMVKLLLWGVTGRVAVR